MNKRTSYSGLNVTCKTGRINEACARYGVGLGTMRKIAEDSQAVIRIGRTYLINFDRVDRYLDNLSSGE